MSACRVAVRELVGLALAFAMAAPASAQDAGGVAGGPGPVGAADLAGAMIDLVEIEVRDATDTAAASALRDEARRALAIGAGDPWNELLVEQGLAAVRALNGVGSADYTLERDVAPQRNRLVVTVDMSTTRVTKRSGFPVLHRSARSFLKVLLNGGFGVFSDTNPWFRNPATFTRNSPLTSVPAIGADTGRRATWAEANVEYGLAGVTPVGPGDFYLYGAATAITVGSVGRDVFRDEARSTTHVEKLYAGLLYAPATGPRVNLSVGRQNFTLNEGFLVSQFGSQYNAGPRPGIYLAPRTTQDMSALLTIKAGKWTWTSFFLNPNEIEAFESNTKLAGTNLRHAFTKTASLDLSYIRIVDSDSRIAVPGGGARARKGVQTVAAHLRWSDPERLPGLWLDGEIAHQWHDDYAMNAWAGYALIGYLARQLPWTPSISYRFSSHTGDDPRTTRFERFDPLFTGGLGEWLQGISFNKVLNASNRTAHRIRTNVSPNPRLNLTFDVFSLRADELNNRGGNPALAQLSSRDLGREFQFVARWAVSPRIYVIGVASHAVPGRAIRNVTPERARPWDTLQAQLFFNF